MFRKSKLAPAALCLLAVGALWARGNGPAVLQIKAGEAAAHVSPMLYGLMTEEINYSYDGGLYGELVRNRNFTASPDDTNSITETTKIIPVTTSVDGLGSSFTREFPPYSITILELRGK